MAECYADFYTDKSKILTLVREGNPKERAIAIGSLSLHFGKEDHFDLAWEIFLSDEHMTVKEHALGTACHFANTKQLLMIAEYVLSKDCERRDLLYSARVLRHIVNRYKENKL